MTRLPPVLRLVVRNFVSNLDFLTLIVMFGQPAILVLILGTMFNNLISPSATGGSYIAFLVPGMVAFQMVTGGVLSGRLFWLDRRWSMVEQIFSGPFLRAEYLAALLLTTLLFAMAGVGIMMVVAFPLIGVPAVSPLDVGVILLTIALGSLFFGGFLIALGSRLRSANMYFTIQSILQYFLIFLSTVYYPISSTTPKVLSTVMWGNPLTYAANTVRDAFTGHFGVGDVVALGILTILASLTFAASIIGFRHIELGPIQ